MTSADSMTVATKSAVCGAPKRQTEGACQRPAGWGTDHPGYGSCKLHGGAAPGPSKAAAKKQAMAMLGLAGLASSGPIGDPFEALSQAAASTRAVADEIGARIGTDVTTEKGKPKYEVEVWLRLLSELRQMLAVLVRAGVPDTMVNVGVGVTIDLDGDRLAADLLAALLPWPDALAAARGVLAQHVDAA
jgi:hypothetical protein